MPIGRPPSTDRAVKVSITIPGSVMKKAREVLPPGVSLSALITEFLRGQIRKAGK